MIETPIDGSPATTPPDSDKALRYLKASEAADAAFAAAGYAAAPEGLKTFVATQINSGTQSVPAGSLSSNSGILAAQAISAVSMVMANLTDQQRDTIKNGKDLDSTAYARLHGLFGGGSQALRGLGVLRSPAGSGGSSPSSARFDGMAGLGAVGPGDWMFLPSVRAAQGLAREFGMSWAANNRELMMLGPDGIKALHDVQLRQESYKQLKDVSFKASEIVSLAKFAKKEHIDANHLSGTVAHTVRILAPNDVHQQRAIDKAVSDYADHPEKPETKQKLLSTIAPLANTPEKRDQALKMTDALKIRHEEAKAALDRNVDAHRKADVKRTQADEAGARSDGKKAKAQNSADAFNGMDEGPAGSPPPPAKDKIAEPKPATSKPAQPSAPKSDKPKLTSPAPH